MFGVDVILTTLVVGYLLHSYGNVRKAPWSSVMVCIWSPSALVRSTDRFAQVFLTWFVCFSIIFVLPMDVSGVCSTLRQSLMMTISDRCVLVISGMFSTESHPRMAIEDFRCMMMCLHSLS